MSHSSSGPFLPLRTAVAEAALEQFFTPFDSMSSSCDSRKLFGAGDRSIERARVIVPLGNMLGDPCKEDGLVLMGCRCVRYSSKSRHVPVRAR